MLGAKMIHDVPGGITTGVSNDRTVLLWYRRASG